MQYRRNISFRENKDEDLIAVLGPFFTDDEEVRKKSSGDFSHFVRELMRDGLKWRQAVSQGVVQDPKYGVFGVPVHPNPVIPSVMGYPGTVTTPRPSKPSREELRAQKEALLDKL